MQITSIDDLQKAKGTGLNQLYPDKPKILVGMATCGRAAGAQRVYDLLHKKAQQEHWDGVVEKTGCIGFCYKEPLVDAIFPGKPRITYGEVTPEIAGALWEELAAGRIPEKQIMARLDMDDMVLNGGPRKFFKGKLKGFLAKTPRYEDLDFFKLQRHIAMRNCGFIDPDNLLHYIARGGYFPLYTTLTTMTPEEVINVVTFAGLRGRGGGGFPTGVKWASCRKAQGWPKYVLCNADEGDPGAYMDRSLIEGDPHAILEGMLIGAYAIGSSEGYIYVRAEYPLAVKTLQRAILSAREAGLLGENIFGTGFNFDIKLNLGGGAFVCGESTALMASIEGKPGEPRAKYVHTVDKGLWNRPSNLNNVETWANVPVIIGKGADWYRDIGTEGSKGTKIFSLVGQVKNVGLVEVPMGVSIKDLVMQVGGGVPENREFKAIQIGGPSGGCIPKEHWDLPIDFDSLWDAGAIMGSGGMIVMDNSTCMVDVAKFFLDFLIDESCGKCIPCRLGLKRMREILEEFSAGKGSLADLDEMESLSEAVKDGSLCALGGSAPNPVLTTLRYFREEYEAHILQQKCPAAVCKELITYTINPELCNGCTACVAECPQDAITGDKKKPHSLDTSLCIKCGACFEVCKFGAVAVA
ncbi:MAG: 4Fe-4S binding protein [Desulfobacterales bacterium]|nr:4Fe-4S binding protein [Pseudomonadota bacterium]MBU4357454.1 4Fe-4S binding protein [Pseudomonadota bacterium]MCG2773300.1 4Fe-4S binding protein [Desulfobacterales bacterium]